MTDLVCVVADKNMEATVSVLFDRPEALGIRQIEWEVLVHPHRDPGCFHEAHALLAGYRDRAKQALVVLDAAWEGAPAQTGKELERLLEDDLRTRGLEDWARAVVIDPELEVWVFSDSPHVATTLGWQDAPGSFRAQLEARSLWEPGAAKPSDPKRAMEWALGQARRPRSSAIYRELAGKVSLQGCRDRSFLRLVTLLRGWFHRPAENA